MDETNSTSRKTRKNIKAGITAPYVVTKRNSMRCDKK